MARRIRVGTEEEWQGLGRKFKAAHDALLEITKAPCGDILPVRYMDMVLRVLSDLGRVKGNFDSEMYRRGGPDDSSIFYGKKEE